MDSGIYYYEDALKKVPTNVPADSTTEDTNVRRMWGIFIRIKRDMADAVQRLPEMTDKELFEANDRAGGFDWLKDPCEDVYEE